MSNGKIVEKTAEYVKSILQGGSSGHDWWHVYRVWKMAAVIAKKEGDVDILVVELAALLHDIAGHKFHGGDLEIGPQKAREWLSSVGVDTEIVERGADIIS